ncbi:MAG: hypothetical protein IJO85_01285 [Lachnospiraceae bacterium]|nr:hypothetical protein [Lachnospiraceae bacterium]
MVRRFARKAGKTLAIALAAAMMFTSAMEPLVVSANPVTKVETIEETVTEETVAEETVEDAAVGEASAEEIEPEKESVVENTTVAEEEWVAEKESTNVTDAVTEEENASESESVTEEETTSEAEVVAEETAAEETTEEETTTEEGATEEETTTEEGTTEEETTTEIGEEPVALMALINPIMQELDITGGLTVGSSYMDGMVSVGTDMTYEAKGATLTSVSNAEVTYEVSGYVTNSTNPNTTDGTGALLRFEAEYDGMITVGAQLGGNKTFYVDIAGGDNVYSYANGADKANLMFENIPVEAGKTYYIYAKGTKMRFYTFSYTYEEPEKSDEPILPSTSDIAAFPGVEGGGKYITGGRGRQVYTVTNLNDNGEGSLRWALEQTKETDGGTIVFNVSGNIELKSSLRFDGIKNVTIAGQTAPGDGITISGYDTNISNSENVIIRYMRFRPGALNVHTGGDSMDAMWGRDNDGFIIDHCSFSWNTDECLSLYRGENGTVQWCLVYESLTLSGHKKGRHGYGGIAGGDNVTFHHNLYANHTSRNPRLGGGYAGNADENHIAVVQMNNNLIYNWGFNTTYGGGYTYTNYINNYALAGPGTRDSVEDWVINPGESSKVDGFYISGNYITNYQDRAAGVLTGTLDTVSEINEHGSFSGAASCELRSEPYLSADSTGANAGVTNEGFDEYLENGIKSAESTYSDVLNKSGATYPKRDAQDARIVSEVKNGEGRYINTEHEVGGYISAGGVIVESREAGWDSDGDGMPDAWEKEKGLDAENAEDGSETSELSEEILGIAGYTNLEVYLSSLVDVEHVAENPTAKVTAPANNAMFEIGTDITVTVEAGSDFGHDVVKAEFYYGTLTAEKKFGEATVSNGKASCTLSGLADGSYFVMARVYDEEGNVTQTSTREIHVNADDTALEEAGWTSKSIGDVDIEGQASLVDGVLSVKGNGKLGREEGAVSGSREADAKTDAFHYVYQEWEGNIELTAKLESVSSVDNHAFAGLMIREDLDEDAATAVLGLSWTKTDDSIGRPWAIYMAGRESKGGNIPYLADALDSTTAEGALSSGILHRPGVQFKNGATELGYWMRLVRNGDNFSAYCSANGIEWELIGTKTIAMSEKVYIGFAADSNRVANEIVQLNTARFSNIDIKSNIYDITYELEGITLASKPETVTEGNDINLTLTTALGYVLPKTVKVQIGDAEPVDMVLDITDPMEGTLTITGINGAVTISGAAEVDTVGVPQVELTEYDTNNHLTILEENGAMILAQTATDGSMTSKPAEGKLAKNVSYVAFPKTTDGQTMEMDITVLERSDDSSKDKGLFVGVFEIGNGREYFTSLGFRHMAGLAGDDGKGGLTGYWMKDPVTKGAGNGGSKSNNGAASNDYNTKPAYELNKTYHVVFEKTENGYKVTYTGTYADAASGVYPAGKSDKAEMDLYKIFADDMLTLEDEVQYGFALTGITVKVENLTLKDSKGRTIFEQKAESEEGDNTGNNNSENSSTDNKNNNSSSNSDNDTQPSESTPASTPTKKLTEIKETKVPMAEQIVEAGALPYANVTLDDEKAVLKLELLTKYYGKNLYLMAHLGNGVGYTIANEELGKAKGDLVLGSSMEKLVDFAADFDTFSVMPLQKKQLSYEIGLHMNVGVEYAGKVAYLFSRNLTTGMYELNKTMTVSEIGNVALMANEITDVMILIAK